MEKTIKILLIALVLLTGCKVTKKATESTVAKTSEQTEAVSTVKENEAFKEIKDMNSEEETVIEETFTEFYVPAKDSSGKSMTIYLTDKGPVKSIKTVRTVKNKKDTDKSKLETTNARQEDTKEVKSSKSEVRSEKKEMKKTGVSNWKLIGGLVALLLVVYFLVKKNVLRIPFMTKVVNLIDGFLGIKNDKTA